MPKSKKPNQQMKISVIFLGIFMLLLMFNMMARQEDEEKTLNYTEFMYQVNLPETDAQRIAKVNIKKNDEIVAVTKEGTSFVINGPKQDADLRNKLEAKNITIEYEPEEESSLWKTLLVNSLPMLLLLFLFIFFMRQLQIGGGKAMSFGKSRAKLQNDNKNKLTFKDVAG